MLKISTFVWIIMGFLSVFDIFLCSYKHIRPVKYTFSQENHTLLAILSILKSDLKDFLIFWCDKSKPREFFPVAFCHCYE